MPKNKNFTAVTIFAAIIVVVVVLAGLFIVNMSNKEIKNKELTYKWKGSISSKSGKASDVELANQQMTAYGGLELELKGDSTYFLSYKGVTETGRWNSNGKTIRLNSSSFIELEVSPDGKSLIVTKGPKPNGNSEGFYSFRIR